MASLIILVCIIISTLVQVHATDDMCDLSYVKDGCFRGNKADMVLAITDRDHTSPNYSGRYLQWENYPKDLRSLICRCNNKAKELGYQHFAIEYYAECWMVSNITQIRSSPASQECVNVNVTTCGQADQECAGKGFHQQVYNASEKWVSIPFANSTGIDVTKVDDIIKLQTAYRQFIIKMNITVNKLSKGTIISCSTGNGAQWFFDLKKVGGKFHFDINRDPSDYMMFRSSTLAQKGEDMEVIVSQILKGGKYWYTIILNGKKEKEFVTENPNLFGGRTCVGGLNFVDATIRNGVIRVRG